ncbi:type I secretion target, putative [Pseudomonas fluorescens Q2-87]|uniref:Type I secretion target, putative n=1 Tax=Pseudomonas fluorescens (strain Q2-87) TaxID=1038922 RepID=J2EPL5_PSEFQ|nr:type I secretion target [Pseudomonas fluorescens]EJL05590.1 type I secretion target, putative [Pseudomonas fluorescens Q2-87]
MATTDSMMASTHTVRTGPGTVQVDLTGQFDDNQSIIIQPDGKVLVVGYTEYLAWGYPGAPGEESYGYEQNYSVIRLNADGSLDTSFHEGGVDIIPTTTAPESRYELTAVQPDGKMLVAIALNTDVRVERFNSDGTRDTTFGQNGAVTVNINHEFKDIDLTANTDGTFQVSARGFDQASVTKIDNDGTYVDGFGDDGVLTVSIPTDEFYNGSISTAVQADGGVVVGAAYNAAGIGDLIYALQRFNPDGQLDTRFGDDGILHLSSAMGFGEDSVVTVQADGKIIVMGHGNGDTLTTVARLNADGSFDSSFGADGRVTFEAGTPVALTIQADGKILAAGTNSGDFSVIRLNADGSVDSSFGSQDGKLHVDGYAGAEILLGSDAAEIIHGLAGDDVLQGNGGRDVLQGGAGADILRFTELGDSFRTATQNNSDRVQDFDVSQDRIDLIALGFTGIGNGHDGTLAISASEDGTRTYLKSYDADASGQRFELVLDGNLVGQLDSSNLVFTAPTIEGSSGKETITGSALSEVIYGLDGNDFINGGAGADVIIGGAGADRLNGGDRADISLWTDNHQNDDVFRYLSTEDSYRTDSQSFSDLIEGFTVDDRIDVSTLGYTGFGDGTGTTLEMVYNQDLDRTYLRDAEADAQGHWFQIALAGDWRENLSEDDMVFAPDQEVGLIGVAPEVDPGHLLT